MMKSLLTTSALVALLATSPSLAQSQPDNSVNPPAAGEPVKPLGTDQAPAGGAMAPDTSGQAQAPETVIPGDVSRDVATTTERFINEQADGQLLASDFIGKSVYDQQDNNLGDVNDILLAQEGDGGIDAVIIGVGGFLGIGEKNVAVSMDAIDRTTDADGNVKLILNVSAEELDAAPAFTTLADLRAKQQQELNAQQPAPAGGDMAPAPAPVPAQ